MIELNDENFEKEIQQSEKPFLVDFWAPWCFPCGALTPVLEKISEEYKEKINFAKVNLDLAPLTGQNYKVEQIPTVIFFRNGKPISGFIGARPEPIIKEWLEGLLKNEKGKLDEVIKEYEAYAAKNGYKLNPKREVVERLITGLLENEKKYGQRYCPCRRVSENQEEDRPKICPCQWHQKEIEESGHCFCWLFVK